MRKVMDEYIAKKQIIKELIGYGDFSAVNVIENFPAADVAPVRRGMWEEIIDPAGGLEGWICSCGRETKSYEKYCPSCGSLNGGDLYAQ